MEKYLECHGTKMYLKEMTPEIEFLFKIFAGNFKTKKWVLDNIDFIIKIMTDRLPEKYKKITKRIYDLPKNKQEDELLIYLDFLSANRPPTLSTAADCSIMLFNE